jgi:hypothetical protein
MTFSKANRAPSFIWSFGIHMEPSVYGLVHTTCTYINTSMVHAEMSMHLKTIRMLGTLEFRQFKTIGLPESAFAFAVLTWIRTN